MLISGSTLLIPACSCALQLAIEELEAKELYDSTMFTSQGPGGIFGLYATSGVHLGYVFVNEFVCVSESPRMAYPR